MERNTGTLEGRVVLVTGASRGIGLSAARALLRSGARVVFAARSKQLLDRHLAELPDADRALAVALDVTSDGSVRDAVRAVLAVFGRIDVVINNAGSGGTLARWLETDSESFRAMFDVHVFGAERVTRAVADPMRAQGGGIIVNVASAVAWVPLPGASAYCAAARRARWRAAGMLCCG